MPAWSGVRLALRALQGTQARTQFSQVDPPPCERGTTWSIVNSSVPGWVPQYWQVQWSRLNRLRRLKVTATVPGRSWWVRVRTSGTRNRNVTAWRNGSPSRGTSRAQSAQV